jgi:hypothetical protein
MLVMELMDKLLRDMLQNETLIIDGDIHTFFEDYVVQGYGFPSQRNLK